MRSALICFAVTAGCSILALPCARGQDAAAIVNRWSASDASAIVNQSGGSQMFSPLRHQQFSGAGSPLFLGGGFPILWSGPYAPVFTPYYPVAPFVPGVNVVPQPANVAPQPAAPAGGVINLGADRPAAKGKPRASNAETKAKAGKFIAYGDTNFAKQKYLPAVERYKTAAQIAPDVADSYFRQAYALVALGQYDDALRAFRRGLKIRPDWRQSTFRLNQIYGNDLIVKTSHLESLAKAVEVNPLDSNLLVVLGLQLYFDGQRKRADVFFARAAQLGANEDRLLDDFIPRPAPAGAAHEQAGGGKIVF